MEALPKRELTAFDLLALVEELKALEGAYVDKVLQPSEPQLVLRMRKPGEGRVELVVEDGRWLYTRGRAPEEPPPPPPFAMLLRKHLEGRRLASVEQRGFERIAILRFDGCELVLELFGEGNVVLVREGVILRPLRERGWEHRQIRPGQSYSFPPPRRDPRALGESELAGLLRNSKSDLVRTLAVSANLGGKFAEEVCARAGLERGLRAARVPPESVGSLFRAIADLLSEVSSRRDPVLVIEGGAPVDFTPIPLMMDGGRELRHMPSVNDALAAYLSHWREVSSRRSSVAGVEEELGRLRRQVESQRRASEAFREQASAARQAAEEIAARAEELDRVLHELRELHRRGGWGAVEEAARTGGLGPVSEVRPHGGEVVMRLGGLAVELDIRKSVREIISSHFERAKDASNKAERARRALEDALGRLRELEMGGGGEEGARAPPRPRPRKPHWFERYRWFISSDGYLVLAGRDASTNDRLVRRHMKEGDAYVHADIHGAPSVVVKGPGSGAEIPERTLREACIFALACSKAWAAGIGSGSAYWVRPDQVSKTPESGEYLPKGAFVVRGRKSYCHDIELRLALGIVEYRGERILMCGPESALRARADRLVGIQPGQDAPVEVARRVARELQCEPEEVSRLLPPGRSQVLALRPEG
ncbi:MAG: ribosome rescue protein RqcH [Thermoplasmatota archaeon]